MGTTGSQNFTWPPGYISKVPILVFRLPYINRLPYTYIVLPVPRVSVKPSGTSTVTPELMVISVVRLAVEEPMVVSTEKIYGVDALAVSILSNIIRKRTTEYCPPPSDLWALVEYLPILALNEFMIDLRHLLTYIHVSRGWVKDQLMMEVFFCCVRHNQPHGASC
jgi:hypothetical protein